MTVLALKLVNGDEILGTLKVPSIPEKTVLIKPALLGMVPDSSGRGSLGLADYLPMSDTKEIAIRPDHILHTYTPKVDLINAYNSMFGSGLVIPPSASGFSARMP